MTMNFDPRKITQDAQTARLTLDSRGVVCASPEVGETIASRWFHQSQPEHYNKQQAFNDVCHLGAYFCVLNSLTVPAFCQVSLVGNALGYASQWSGRKYLIQIDANKCGKPREGSPPFMSWPGHQYDDTVTGTVAHEIGHIAHWHVSDRITRLRRKEIEVIAMAEPEVITAYEKKNADERWAEAMRLFILNPSLLKKRWPMRFEYLSTLFLPAVQVSSEEILAGLN